MHTMKKNCLKYYLLECILVLQYYKADLEFEYSYNFKFEILLQLIWFMGIELYHLYLLSEIFNAGYDSNHRIQMNL